MVTSTTKTIMVSSLMIIVATALITIVNMDSGFRIDVLKNQTNFYLYDNSTPELSGTWILGGTEQWKIYDNNKPYNPSSVAIKNTLLKNNKTMVTRTAKYTTRNITVIDVYTFDGNTKNIELFPIQHTINVTCKNCTYKYMYDTYSPKMKVEYDTPNDMYGKNLVYNIQKNRVFSVRMFDPAGYTVGWYSGNDTNIITTGIIQMQTNSSLQANMTNITYYLYDSTGTLVRNYTVAKTACVY